MPFVKNVPLNKVKETNGFENATTETTTSTTTNSGPEVFLGGSCNPTTWRADVAIPALKDLGISFYNPVSIVFIYEIELKLHLSSQ